MIREEVKKIIEENKKDFEEISDKVWEFAENSFEEIKSSELQADYLEKRGFRVERNIANMETGFIAEWGEGKPVIAVLGENDALPGLSQEAGIAEQKPLVAGAPGHGCGHNLLGTCAMEAACAVKEYMEKHGTKGTIRYYGTPAEEGGGGKVFMILDGRFKDVDCTLAWHPGTVWDVNKRALGVILVYFKFEGKAAHAAGNPEMGRSALDALELMNLGVQFLREHVRQGTYIHYSIINAGGSAANIVQPEAEALYMIRNPDLEYLNELYGRVVDIAKGAALMTGTKCLEPRINSAYAPIIPNSVLDDIQFENMKAILPLDYTEEELEFGKKFVAVGGTPNAEYPFETEAIMDQRVTCTDACDVSWVTPMSHIGGCTLARGTVGHNWAVVAQGKSDSAKRGMHATANVLANSAIDLMENPELVEKAQAEFKETMKDKQYKTIMENCTPSFRQ